MIYESLMKATEKSFGELRKMVEAQKIAEEQERLRKIQVAFFLIIISFISLLFSFDVFICVLF